MRTARARAGAGLSWLGALLLLLALGATTSPVRAHEVKLTAAAAGKTAQLACGGGTIAVTSATFTKVAGSTAVCTPVIPGSVADVTHLLTAACNGKISCAYPACPFAGFGTGAAQVPQGCIKSVVPPLGDPCPNVPKDFVSHHPSEPGVTLLRTAIPIATCMS